MFDRQIWDGKSRFEVFFRGHLWVEHYLERLLELTAARPDSLPTDRLSWTLKLNLCDALGLVYDWEVTVFAEMNRIRNKLAHDLAAEPTEQEIARFVRLSPPHVLEAIQAGREVEEKAGSLGDDEALTELRLWLLGIVMDLDFRIETRIYEKRHEDQLWRAAGTKAGSEIAGKPITQQEAEQREGMPPRPTPGDIFRRALD